MVKYGKYITQVQKRMCGKDKNLVRFFLFAILSFESTNDIGIR